MSAVFFEDRPAVMVVSHERSGTHFLMNALSTCYGYVSQPWLNLEQQGTDINFFHPPSVRKHLLDFASVPLATIVKSHHQADFFAGELPAIGERYVIFVVYRHPADVLLSFWRFLHQWPWFEGPNLADPVSFAKAEPCGALLRYQTRQHPDMLRRWASHVEGWLEVARGAPRVSLVRYEDLDTRYEATVRSLAPLLGRGPRSLARPTKDVNVVPGGPQDPTGSGRLPDIEILRRLCRQTMGDTMSRLGY